MKTPEDAPGVLEALEVSEFVYEMRVERALRAVPRLTRSEAVAMVNAEDLASSLAGTGHQVRGLRRKNK